ncbi:prolyl oligopeptidase family serine peptidase [Shewanella sp. GD03713]|uniref:S9 family peptidase n=1 Tax=Shewanella sp. GD03713 TaxID=2975372 RepID=UPI000B347BE8|nr:prolyl oligopeptidase family serine peptidase [Shewanella sp. GD03713]MDH1471048.1 prolyl oligopeptidase family serine peptidase [Shewanella sp. GD03713]QXN26308.1 prolyl oligopeptidase family serine peptidase [Shewanella putrefaciens]
MGLGRYLPYLLSAVLLLGGCERTDTHDSSAKENGDIKVAPYGSWQSPLSAASVFEQADDIAELQSVGDAIYFAESSGSAQGKVGIKRLDDLGKVTEVVPPDFNVRSTVHEYGGAAFLGIGQSLFATKLQDQLFYRFAPNQPPLPLTPNGTRHADCVAYPKGSRIICVREDHRQGGEPKASLVTINLNFAGEGDTFVTGHDFISSPTISPDNTQLAWITWEHPYMPWDNSVLWLGDLDRKGQLKNIRKVNTPKDSSVTQPLFGPDGNLYVVSDLSNWWNIYRVTPQQTLVPVLSKNAEFAVADWRLGNHNYAFENASTLIASYVEGNRAALLRMHLDSGLTESLAVDFAEITQVVKGEDGVYFVGAKATPEKGIYRVVGRGTELVYAPALPNLDPNYVSRAKNIAFATGKNQQAYGYFYGPVNPNYIAPHDTRPPLIVMLHGGPTARASLAYRSEIQFWTSRGFAVLDLNFRGSSGFGRAYRQSLYGKWGESDVEDAVNAAKYLVAKGWVDANKLAIRGISAGGLTVMSSLAFYDVFQAGVSYEGISDFEQLAKGTHKFESGYLDQLIGPYPEMKQRYRELSPLNHLDGLNEPLLIFQGLRNKIVPTAYIDYGDDSDEGRTPEHKAAGLETELAFYGQVFHFTPAGKLPALQLDNVAALKH